MNIKKKTFIALIINCIIAVVGILGAVFSFTDVKITGSPVLIENSNSLQFFTFQSNIIVTVLCVIAAVYEYLNIKKGVQIPKILIGLKIAATVGVALTFMVVLLYLAPFNPYGFFSMYTNNNLLFHFLIPVLATVNIIFFEGRKDVEFYYTFIGMIHMIVYSVYYNLTIVFNLKDGQISPDTDWYRFYYNGTGIAILIIFATLLTTYLISFLLWKLNRKTAK
ncbi:MAG: hypothetical protein SPL13_02950 [Clostridia bacterium]|nr:hypothetical protein [Clostridia bacterium]